MKAHFILYVADQNKSTEFYSSVLCTDPTLAVPGMTEFRLSGNTILGLMPEDSAVRLLGDIVGPKSGKPFSSRAELYLVVEDAAAYHERALAAGGLELSGLALRDRATSRRIVSTRMGMFWHLRKRSNYENFF